VTARLKQGVQKAFLLWGQMDCTTIKVEPDMGIKGVVCETVLHGLFRGSDP
jgi:hypothetical protein